jgi:hypothetical protein
MRPTVDPLAGTWELNLADTRYGPGVDRRTQETFSCTPDNARIHCTITSVRSNGQTLTGSFAAAYDGATFPVTGIPDVNTVRLQRTGERAAEAVFSLNRTPVFGYRIAQSQDGRRLTIASIDPVTRVALTTVVAYDRVPSRSP